MLVVSLGNVRRVVVADLHGVDEAVHDRMAVDPGIEIGDDRHHVRREPVASAGGRDEVLGLARPVPRDRDLQAAAGQQRQDGVGAVSRRDHERSRDDLAPVGGHADRGAVGLDRRRLDALDRADAARPRASASARFTAGRSTTPPSRSRWPRSASRYGKRRSDRARVERLRPHPQPCERLEALLRIGAGQVGRDGALGDVQAAAADEHLAAGPLLEVDPEPEGLVREPRVGRVQVVVAERAGAAVRGGHRIADPATLQHHDPCEPL